MGAIDTNAVVKILFNTDSTTPVEVLTVFMLRFVFYILITFFIIFLLHLIAKALNKSIQLRKGFHGFMQRYWDSVLYSIVAHLIISHKHNL